MSQELRPRSSNAVRSKHPVDITRCRPVFDVDRLRQQPDVELRRLGRLDTQAQGRPVERAKRKQALRDEKREADIRWLAATAAERGVRWGLRDLKSAVGGSLSRTAGEGMGNWSLTDQVLTSSPLYG